MTMMIGSLFTTPQEVHDAKIQLDNEMVATNRQWESVALGNASNNPNFSQTAANDFFSWSAFWNSWNSFAIEESSLASASSDLDRVSDYATQLGQWQARLKVDTNIAPILPATPPTQSGGALASVGSQIVRPLLIAAGLAVVAFALVEAAPFVAEFAKARKRSRAR